VKAVCKTRAGVGATYSDWADPESDEDSLLVRVERASICGSDLAIYNWNSWAPGRLVLPLVFGHELCGTVVDAGSRTRGFESGDFVSVESHIWCGLCTQCRSGQRHVCQNLKIIGVDAPGGFAEFIQVPARCAWKHADRSLKDIGSLMEPLGNAIYATLVEEVVGKSVLVLGCGPQGLFGIQVAKASGAKPVIAVEASPFRRKMAEKAGADTILDPGKANPLGRILKMTSKNQGVDVVLEMSGNPKAVELGLRCVRNGGRLTAFGLPAEPLKVQWSQDIVFKGIRIYGITGREIFQTWYTMEKLLRSGALDVHSVITHRFPLKDFKRAFEVMNSRRKDCGKVLLEVG